MLSKIVMFGINIPIEVPDKKKKRRRGKALSAPRKDKMVKTSVNKEVGHV